MDGLAYLLDGSSEGGFVFVSGLGEAHARAGLDVDEVAESSLGADDCEWDLHLVAESWEIQDELLC